MNDFARYGTAVFQALLFAQKKYPGRECSHMEISPGVSIFTVEMILRENSGIKRVGVDVDINAEEIVSSEEIR